MALDDLLTVDEAAAALRVNPKTIRRWIAAGHLHAQRPGPRTMRITRVELERFLAVGQHAQPRAKRSAAAMTAGHESAA